MLNSLKNRWALVTGASAGIGRATALKLADIGMNVVVSGRRSERLNELVTEIELKKVRALAWKMDITEADFLESTRIKSVEGLSEALEQVQVLPRYAPHHQHA